MLWKRRPDRQPATTVRNEDPSNVVPDVLPEAASDFLSRLPRLRCSLGPDTSVSGRLSFTVPTRIDGRLRGEVRASDVLVIGETGFIDGTVRAANLIVLGRVDGDVVGAERVEIGPKGTLQGVVETCALVVQEGGALDGDCRISPGRATVHVLHPKLAAATHSAPATPQPPTVGKGRQLGLPSE